jgi:diaminopimelate decarboxylase
MNNQRQLLKKILDNQSIREEDHSFIVYDLDAVEKTYLNLVKSYPTNTLHAIAIKACPLPFFLKLQNEFGLGAEAASIEEVHLALKSGVPTDRIVFDGPAKTVDELNFCIENAIYINIDSFEELARVKRLRPSQSNFKAGLRLNPQIGVGKIKATSVATRTSKFGVEMNSNEEKIKNAFKDNPWLVGTHVHIGSQGMILEELVEGTKKVAEFSLSLAGIEKIDLGGGLPVFYRQGDGPIEFDYYMSELHRRCPQLFDSKVSFITELGRKIYANNAFAASRVEYVKNNTQLVTHLGADMFLRPVYCPDDWGHQFSVASHSGDEIRRDPKAYDLAGPLCFGGDFIGRNITLPTVAEHDYLLIHDVGAYTLSMWSRHCSRATPKVLGVKGNDIKIIKNREAYEDIFRFWGGNDLE